MKGYKQKLGVLLLALVLALGGLGVSYAHWAQNLEISGTVNTGNWSLGFTGEECDFELVGGSDPEYDCTCEFTDSDGDGDYDIMEATMISVNATCSYELSSPVSNNGTLPMKIDTVDIDNPDPDLVTIDVEEPPDGTQVDPGGEVECRLYIVIGDEDLDEYSFSVQITSSLWNQ